MAFIPANSFSSAPFSAASPPNSSPLPLSWFSSPSLCFSRPAMLFFADFSSPPRASALAFIPARSLSSELFSAERPARSLPLRFSCCSNPSFCFSSSPELPSANANSFSRELAFVCTRASCFSSFPFASASPLTSLDLSRSVASSPRYRLLRLEDFSFSDSSCLLSESVSRCSDAAIPSAFLFSASRSPR